MEVAGPLGTPLGLAQRKRRGQGAACSDRSGTLLAAESVAIVFDSKYLCMHLLDKINVIYFRKVFEQI